MCEYSIFYTVTKLTGITQTMLRAERPLSVVLPLFIEWLMSAATHVSDATSTVHYPGMLYYYFIPDNYEYYCL